MKTIVITLSFFLLIFSGASIAQNLSSDYKTIVVNKQVKEFPDKFDLSTPLNAGLTCHYIMIDGTEKLWRDACSKLITPYLPESDAPNIIISQEVKERRLNDSIKEVLIYKDSIAYVITFHLNSYFYRSLVFENGKWVSNGEDSRDDIQAVRNLFKMAAPISLATIHKMEMLKKVSTDTLAFIQYAKNYGKTPNAFILQTLAKHKLVIYGEVHRRKISWDLLKEIIKDPQFSKIVGTVFLELPSYQQSEFDRFYGNEKLDTSIVLNILRSQQIDGWWDKGEYEFLVDLWHVNQKLPQDKRICVVGADEQPIYQSIHTPEELKTYMDTSEDRNEHMANTIERIIKSKPDKRNNLFVVGFMHSYKSFVPTNYPEYTGNAPKYSAGAELSRRFSKEDVFVIFQHCPRMNNFGVLFGEIRQGLFDTAFARLGNKPVAFNLFNSPFGAELFDGDEELSRDYRTGSFENNFDGYIFLGPLKDELVDYLLYEICSDEFIKELERRFALMNTTVKDWYEIEEPSRESIIRYIKEQNPKGKKRWSDLYELKQ